MHNGLQSTSRHHICYLWLERTDFSDTPSSQSQKGGKKAQTYFTLVHVIIQSSLTLII